MLLYYLYECQNCGERLWVGPHESLAGEPIVGWIVQCKRKTAEYIQIATSKHKPLR